MPNYPWIRRSALALLAVLSCFAQGQERWYQVELMIFSHEPGSTAEVWEPLPQLAYPDAARFLVYPALVEARLEEHGGQSEVDEFGRQFITPLPDPETDPLLEAGVDAAGPAALGPGDPNLPLPAEPVLPPETELAPTTPTPFIALPHARREFHGKSAYMQRTGRYRTLFHETWVQPVLSEADALPLIVDQSGDTGTWPRLQGSVKLHLSRYLHLETNLWLNTPGGYLPGEWSMPPPPLGPPSLVVELPEPELEPADQLPAYDAPPSYPGFFGALPEDPNQPEEETEPVYPWRHAVLMQQTRRMRSMEVHYLDHPLLGVVIQLTPLDEEQLQLLAEAEAEAEAEDEAPPL